MIAIRQVNGRLPEAFDLLIAAAEAEGVKNMSLLAARWQDHTERFNSPGEKLFYATRGQDLLGVAGVSRETNLKQPAMRMRRLYVTPVMRRRGIARKLAEACILQGFAHANMLTCNARASIAAGPFWETVGFVRVDWPNVTHIYNKS